MLDLWLDLDSEDEMLQLGSALSQVLPKAALIFLHGPLGAGKTTLVRGVLRASGVIGAVKSPTYTLVESYDVNQRHFHHFDLYRLADPEELELMGIRDYLDGQSICFIEWPERGEGILSNPDIEFRISLTPSGRRLEFEPHTETGVAICQDVLKKYNKNFDKQ